MTKRKQAEIGPATTAAQDTQDETVQAARAALTGKAVAGNTRRAYASALQRLDRWLDGVPLADAILATYVARLWVDGKSLSLAALTVAAAWRAREDGAANPVGPETTRVLGGLRRAAAEDDRGPRQL